MSRRYYHVEETFCDQCQRKHRRVSAEDDEGIIPKDWVQIAANPPGNKCDGNERLFATLCPACYKALPFSLHTAAEDDLYFSG